MNPNETLEIFGPLWWKANFIVVLTIFIILSLAKWINDDKKQILGYIIGLILIIRTIGVHFYWDYLGIWSMQLSLPLHLCGLSAILSGFVLFWRNQLAFECLYYWGIVGAFHALMTPEFTRGTHGLLFYEFYVTHGGIILSALYLTIIFGMRPRRGSWWKIFFLSQFLIIIIGFINYLLNSNYMYLCVKPIANNLFLLGEWPWYIVGIELAAILHFILVYIPFGVKYLYNKSSHI